MIVYKKTPFQQNFSVTIAKLNTFANNVTLFINQQKMFVADMLCILLRILLIFLYIIYSSQAQIEMK